MHFKHRRKMGIMNLNAANVVLKEQTVPDMIHAFILRK